MQLVPELSKKIIKEVQLVMTENIIVVDERGIIIASTDEGRIGTFHEGATIVMKTKQKLYITKEKAEKLEGVKPGINLPITFENEVIGVIGITGIPVDVEPFAEIIRRMTELIIREASHIEKKEWETRGLESFFYEWIYTNKVDQEFINRGHILGIHIDTLYLCVFFQFDLTLSTEEQQHIQGQMISWFEKKFPKNKNDFIVRWGHGRFILFLDAGNRPSLKNLSFELERCQQYFKNQYQAGLAIGVGKSIEHHNVYRSYQEAEKALKVAVKSHKIVFYEELILDIVLEEVTQPTRDEFTDRVLLAIRHDYELLETLKVYFLNNQSLKKTADDLHVHINTLHYRLKQIKDLTGIDPKKAEGITLFYIALCFLELR
ncbi:CdaR family transcriptional regulator [Jeotgalibacillus soli]|uniref:Sugar diacid utilization regulator n=1 Tax=Jeotgalibacillus soli TaxID=889306 RepID=A0A0C2VKL1_9BACL|nr:sugar diacid recognition domain-containing protein [Jeotgalibacillus soli]KIL49442.1 sugar diacid utilization regulator [Jeotgalibacillus soli]